MQPAIIEGPYLRDILQQPQALRQSHSGLEAGPQLEEFARRLAAGDFQRLILTGMGSSLFALYPLHLALTNHGLPSLLVETSELIHYLGGILDQRALVVAVSQSGRSAEIVRLLDLAKGRARIIGVTNDTDSPLALQPESVLLLRAGAESTVTCKTYVVSLMALDWLGAILMGGNLAERRDSLAVAAPAVESYLTDWRQHVSELSGLLADVTQVFVTGRGPSIATALTGGLILKESTRFPAEGMSCAAFRHGPFEMLAPHVFVAVMGGDSHASQLNGRLAEDIALAGGKSALAGAASDRAAFRLPRVPDAIRPIVEILPVQMISLALAAKAGREAGRFELASKITSVE